MSTIESPQDFAEQVAERLVDQSPAWGLPRIQAGQMVQGILADARLRAHDSHKVQMKAIGGEASELPEMPDTNITRDVYNITNPTPNKSSSKIGSALLAAASVAMGLAGGAAGLAVLQWWLNRPETPAVQTVDPSEWQLGIEVKNEP